MPARKYHVALTPEERSQIEIVARSYHHSSRERIRAKVLLMSDTQREGGPLKDGQIAQDLQCHILTVGKIRKIAVSRGALAALDHKEQTTRKERALDGAGEAALIAITCSTPPDGRKSWTMTLIKDKLIEREIVETIHESTICRTLKKMSSSPG